MKLKKGNAEQNCCSFSASKHFCSKTPQPNLTLCFARLNLLCVNQSGRLTVQSWKLSVHARGGVSDLLHARPSCVWADNSSACSHISHQPQLAQTLWGGGAVLYCICMHPSHETAAAAAYL